MKKITKLILTIAAFQLVACASLFEDRSPASVYGGYGEEDYDRGYSRDSSEEEDKQCVGRNCEGDESSQASVMHPEYRQRRPSSLTNGENRRIKTAIETRDIVLGMTRTQVLQSWGEPTMREVAGRGQQGNERWRYGTRMSLSGERVVIFENGRVAGWYR